MALYFETFAKLGDFDGRSTRTEYFVFVIASALCALPVVTIDKLTGMHGRFYELGPLTFFYLVLLFLTSLSLQVRRLHDAGFNGWWFLATLIPFFGIIAQFAIPLWEGTDGTNEYGPDPRVALANSLR